MLLLLLVSACWLVAGFFIHQLSVGGNAVVLSNDVGRRPK